MVCLLVMQILFKMSAVWAEFINVSWLQNGYKNSETTEKIAIFRKYDYKKPRKYAICQPRFSQPNPWGWQDCWVWSCGYYHWVISKKLDFMGLSEKSGSPFWNFATVKMCKAVPKRCHKKELRWKRCQVSSEFIFLPTFYLLYLFCPLFVFVVLQLELYRFHYFLSCFIV